MRCRSHISGWERSKRVEGEACPLRESAFGGSNARSIGKCATFVVDEDLGFSSGSREASLEEGITVVRYRRRCWAKKCGDYDSEMKVEIVCIFFFFDRIFVLGFSSSRIRERESSSH